MGQGGFLSRGSAKVKPARTTRSMDNGNKALVSLGLVGGERVLVD